jgi:hypothetical protein
LNKTQQDEKDIIERGMLSIMQMHSNETGTAEAKSWKNTFNDISALYHEELNLNKLIDSVMIETPQEQYNAPAPTEANAKIGEDDVSDDSDDDDKTSSHTSNHTTRFSLFDDEEDNDIPDTQSPLDKGSVHEKNAGIISHDTAATDKHKNDSGKENNKEVDNFEQQEDSEEETGGTATGNDKSDQESAKTNKSDAADNKKGNTKQNLKAIKTKKRKR